MRTCFRLIALILFVASCQGKPGSKKAGPDNTAAGTHPDAAADVRTGDTLNTEDFSQFWHLFRKSVLGSDTGQIIAMTEFPFQARGPLDSDPTIEYDRRTFLPVFQAFLSQWNGQWNGVDSAGSTELESIKETITPNKTDIVKDYARIGDLVFNKTGKGWKLVFAYLDYETIDSLRK